MFSFDPASYGKTVEKLLDGDRLCELGPGVPNKPFRASLNEMAKQDIFQAVRSSEMAKCCRSGLWLWHDFLDESHSISQDIDSPEGSYWHGIMHRREPDYSNAKYWYRRVGEHAIFQDLLELSIDLAARHELDGSAEVLVNTNSWDPYAFVDLCSDVARGRSKSETFCREVAKFEWQLLFDHCYHHAVA